MVSFFIVILSKITSPALFQKTQLNNKRHLFFNLFKYSFAQIIYIFTVIIAIREFLDSAYDYYVLFLCFCALSCIFFLLQSSNAASKSKKQMKTFE